MSISKGLDICITDFSNGKETLTSKGTDVRINGIGLSSAQWLGSGKSLHPLKAVIRSVSGQQRKFKKKKEKCCRNLIFLFKKKWKNKINFIYYCN